ncbi:TPA: hypothetical protein N0F65_004945 [Lagenidium giganteum]|uniref:FHA domain-containing protein n=1 Tax=Lagenidium giganteum TaxID=4803 RepID=A0AAV2YXJ1_9STRA|nr:TPA: hypothetical protein N0F65_004945 [Lagenidium giganteum]
MEPVCDLVLQHPSISRVHAVLQFDSHGALFLKDNRSTYGTFINKKRLPADEFTRVHVGDVVVFGESTRIYAVCGSPELLPDEYESANLQKLRQRSEDKAKQRKPRQNESDGISWGFGDDAEEEDDDEDDDSGDENGKTDTKKGKKEALPTYLRKLEQDENATPYKSRVQASDVNAKDQKLFEQLQKRITKLENLKQETKRILVKQDQLTGLSEGQEKTLQRNEERIAALKKEIDDLEGRIQAKNTQRQSTNTASAQAPRQRSNRNEALYGYDSDEDDFYDRTKANQMKLQARKQQVESGGKPYNKAATSVGPTKSGGALTAETIQVRIKELEQALEQVQNDEDAMEQSLRDNREAEAPAQAAEEMDSLDSFMENTTKELENSSRATLAARRREVEVELAKQQQLLRVAMPALANFSSASAKQSTNTSNTKPSSPTEKKASQTSEPTKQSTPQQPSYDDMEKKPEVSSPPAQRAQQDAQTPPRSEKAPGEAPIEDRKVAPQPQEREEAKVKRRRVMGPTLPPPAAAQAHDSNVLEGGERVWVPPKGQTGDGRTKLNEKLGY